MILSIDIFNNSPPFKKLRFFYNGNFFPIIGPKSRVKDSIEDFKLLSQKLYDWLFKYNWAEYMRFRNRDISYSRKTIARRNKKFIYFLAASDFNNFSLNRESKPRPFEHIPQEAIRNRLRRAYSVPQAGQ